MAWGTMSSSPSQTELGAHGEVGAEGKCEDARSSSVSDEIHVTEAEAMKRVKCKWHSIRKYEIKSKIAELEFQILEKHFEKKIKGE